MTYIDNGTYRRQKAALTRAINSGDPEKVKATVVATVRAWNAGGYAWPDSWATWNIALQDAVSKTDGYFNGGMVHVDNIR